MAHKCAKCKYYYETECNKSETYYDALMDAIRPHTVLFMGPCCGKSPGGICLDREAPMCDDSTVID